MPYVITDSCTKCGACVEVCPTDSIHEGVFESYDQMFINPDTCTECGACEGECPSTAIFADFDLADDMKKFIKVNADAYSTGAVSG